LIPNQSDVEFGNNSPNSPLRNITDFYSLVKCFIWSNFATIEP